MAPFVKLRKFMNDTLFDMCRSRSLLGRDVKHGSWVKVGYNQYSIDYRKELLRYVLTIDANEQIEAEKLGIAPRFQLIGYSELAAIQYAWAKEGTETAPADAITIWHDVHTYNRHYTIPETKDTAFEPHELNYAELNFIAGAERHEYRYINLDTLSELFDAESLGLEADRTERKVFPCHKTLLDGSMKLTTPFKQAKRNTIDAYLAEQYINDAYFDLEANGVLDPENNVCPTFIIKDMLYNEVIAIRKGGLNRLHQDIKRAQVYSAITSANRVGCSMTVESVVLAHSVKEDEFLSLTSQSNQSKNDVQMALSF